MIPWWHTGLAIDFLLNFTDRFVPKFEIRTTYLEKHCAALALYFRKTFEGVRANFDLSSKLYDAMYELYIENIRERQPDLLDATGKNPTEFLFEFQDNSRIWKFRNAIRRRQAAPAYGSELNANKALHEMIEYTRDSRRTRLVDFGFGRLNLG